MTKIANPLSVRAERSRGTPAPAPSTTLGTNGLGKASKAFEAVFLRQMIAAMRAPSLGDGLFGSDAANQFRDMSDARLADQMAGRFGIAAIVERSLGK